MSQTYTDTTAHETGFSSADLPGKGQSADKMQGHWVLARVGKRVLRPGGIELTRRMLDALAIGPGDDVVEFAPGLGATAGIVLQRHPDSYCAVERDPVAAKLMRRKFAASNVVQGGAEDSGLPAACASVVYSEALLSMQVPQQKSRIIAEARRLLREGGRYGIQELCLLPDDISAGLRQQIQADMSKEIHVGVQPLCPHEWVRLFQENGLRVTWIGTAPMHLLEPGRLLRDEGIAGGLRIAFRAASNPALGKRILAMRRLFHKYSQHLGAISLVGECLPPVEEEYLGAPS
ncbi:MAG: methyltransferase domain-containing protein [Acidobacteriaceae bacterium]